MGRFSTGSMCLGDCRKLDSTTERSRSRHKLLDYQCIGFLGQWCRSQAAGAVSSLSVLGALPPWQEVSRDSALAFICGQHAMCAFHVKARLLNNPFPLHYSSRIRPFASCFRRPNCFLTSVFSGFCWYACATQVTRCAKEYTAHDTLPQQYLHRYITLTIEIFSSFCAPHVQEPVITLASRESMS